jgi:hypothetical protein
MREVIGFLVGVGTGIGLAIATDAERRHGLEEALGVRRPAASTESSGPVSPLEPLVVEAVRAVQLGIGEVLDTITRVQRALEASDSTPATSAPPHDRGATPDATDPEGATVPDGTPA